MSVFLRCEAVPSLTALQDRDRYITIDFKKLNGYDKAVTDVKAICASLGVAFSEKLL